MDNSVKISTSAGAPKRILIAPLDWGLGHTSRCVPIIRRLLELGHGVTVAGNSSQLDYYRPIFPDAKQLLLEGYNVRYGKKVSSFLLPLLRQLPGILRSIGREHRWLEERAADFDGVISDNRYGLWSKRLPAVIITHQLRIFSGLGRFADGLLQRAGYRLLNRFGSCWVPDLADGAKSLAGALSHPEKTPGHVRYAGFLSAVEGTSIPAGEKPLVVLLSGPEPQRSLLSDLLWEQVQTVKGPVVFIEGSSQAPERAASASIKHYQRLGPDQVQRFLKQAGAVVCRSGYSSLMDIGRIGCRCILIPTPGQTEQEYLAASLQQKGLAVRGSQARFDLRQSLEAVQQLPPFYLDEGGAYSQFIPLLDDWLRRL